MSPTVEPSVCPACGQVRLTVAEVVRQPGQGLRLTGWTQQVCGCTTTRAGIELRSS